MNDLGIELSSHMVSSDHTSASRRVTPGDASRQLLWLHRPAIPRHNTLRWEERSAVEIRRTPACLSARNSGATLVPLYEAGEYAQAADRAQELIKAHPEYPTLLYNVACCESLAGRTADAIEHLRLAIEGSDRFRSLAAGDSDFDPTREAPAFNELVG